MAEARSTAEQMPDASDRVSMRSWYALFVLILLFLVSMIDRSIISMLIGSIKADLGLDDFQVSLLMGAAFGICYVLFATPFGWAADRFPRPYVLAFGLAFWSLACMSCGLAGTFLGLFVSRMAVGAGEACLSPSAYPLLSELFPRRRVPTALALYHLGGVMGGAMALFVGGIVVSFTMQTGGLSLPLLGELRPWQLAFVVVGLPGLPLVLLALTLPEPRRQPERRIVEAPQPGALKAYVWSHRRLLFCHHFGFALALMVAYGKGFWLPEFLVRKFGWDMVYIGSLLAAMGLIAGLISQFVAVQVIGLLSRRGHSDAVMRGYISIMVVGTLASVLAFSTDNVAPTIAGLFLSSVVTSAGMTCGSSSLQLLTPVALRGRLSGIFVSVTSLMGLGIGPSVIGALTEYVLGGKDQIGNSLLIFAVTCQLGVIALLAWGLAPARKAMAEVAPAPDTPPAEADPGLREAPAQ